MKNRLIAALILLPALLSLCCFVLVWIGTVYLDRSIPVERLLPAGVLRVGIDPSNPPFAFYDHDALIGLDIDLARALAARMAVEVQLLPLGFDGIYDALKIGQVDMLIAALTVDPARTGLARYSAPYFNAGLLLVSAPEHPVQSMDDIAGRRLAVEFGSEADAEARRWLRRIQPFELRPYERPTYALDAVRLHQADAALVDAVTARLYLRQHPDWTPDWAYVTVLPMAAAVHIDREQLGAALDWALASLFADGTIESLLERWL